MTRDEARYTLIHVYSRCQWGAECDQYGCGECEDAINMAIEALLEKSDDSKSFSDSAEPSGDITCKTCADRAMCVMSAPDGNWKACKDYRPTGEWHDSFGFAHCSLCGFGVPRPIGKETSYNYCPYCGARLYKVGESHEAD